MFLFLNENMNILIVEDNIILNNNISKYLEINNIKSKQLFDWESVTYELLLNNYDAIILDIWLPKKNWLEICDSIRKNSNPIPIIFLTARITTRDKINWLNIWADDYLTKPFDYEELIARLKSLVRRNHSIKADKIKIKDIEIDTNKNKINKNWEDINLSKLEFSLLLYLSNNKWKIISKKELIEKVWWEHNYLSISRTVDVYIWYLRKKLWRDLIETKRWVWYLIK